MTGPAPTGQQATAIVQAPPPPQAPPAPPKFQFTTPLDDEFLNALIYGDFGSGKSTLAATASEVPAMQDVLYIAAEAGEKVLVPYAKNGHLTVVRVGKYSTVARVYEWMVAHCKYRDAGDIEKLRQLEAMITGTVPDKPKLFRTVVLDSLTEIQVYLMYQLLGITDGTPLDLPPDTAEFKEWGQSSEMIKRMIRFFRDLHLNVILVCSMEEKEDEKKRQLKRLLLPGKLATSVQGFLDVVGFLEKLKVEVSPQYPHGYAWRLHMSSGQTFHAKHRFGPDAPPHLDMPTMADLFALNQAAPTTVTETNTDASATANTQAGSSTQQANTRPAGSGAAAGSGVRPPVRVGGSGPVRPGGSGSRPG